MQLLPTDITIIEIIVVVLLAVLGIVGLVLTIMLKTRVTALEAALNEERRRMAEIHTFLERISRTNITRPDMEMPMSADPYGANPYAAQQAQAMGAMGQAGMVPDYNPYGAAVADPALAAGAPQGQGVPYAAAAQPAYDAQAMRAQEQQAAAKQQALEYAKYQERMQAHVDQMQQQAMMPGQPGARPQRQTQPVPPR